MAFTDPQDMCRVRVSHRSVAQSMPIRSRWRGCGKNDKHVQAQESRRRFSHSFVHSDRGPRREARAVGRCCFDRGPRREARWSTRRRLVHEGCMQAGCLTIRSCARRHRILPDQVHPRVSRSPVASFMGLDVVARFGSRCSMAFVQYWTHFAPLNHIDCLI